MFFNIALVISTMRSGWRDLLALDCELRSGLQAHSAACSVRDDRRVVRRTPLRASNSTKASRKHKLPEALRIHNSVCIIQLGYYYSPLRFMRYL